MLNAVKKLPAVKRFRKSMLFSRLRQRLPMPEAQYIDDRGLIEDAEVVRIDWPANVAKPRVGIVRDLEEFPRWTKYRRFLETNGFAYDYLDIHSHDWIDRARSFDLVIGLVSNEISYLEEIRVKYHFLESYLGKACYPSAEQTLLYDNKCLEAYISDVCDLPFAKTHISHSHEDALALVEGLRYPLVSKVNHSSGSLGVELVRTPQKARRIVRKAFSRNGRSIHVPWLRQKNYVYFQEFIPNDGYDIRVIVVGNRAFGYYRKVLGGDFRASGMDKVEKRALPEEAIRIARKALQCIRSPQIVVDMVHGLDGRYAIIEFSIVCQMQTPEQLLVDGVPGVYIIDDDGDIRFEKGRYWVHELALRKFLLDEYLPRASGAPAKAPALCRP
ncbi:MAG: ATP-grasp domain-containing protein [Candidatus Aminicenantales bacterium]